MKVRRLHVAVLLTVPVVTFLFLSGSIVLFEVNGEGQLPAGASSKTRIVLAWTPIFSDWNFWYPPGLGYRPFRNELCHYDDCYLTTDRSYLDRASAVLFHCRDSFYFWPGRRRPDQLYGAVCHESPVNSDFSQYADRINLTITYRRDSDIYFPQCWFEPVAGRVDAPSAGAPTYKPLVPLSDRRHDVVWPVSNCDTASRRERYVSELRHHIDVHVYGACGEHRCPKSEGDGCMRRFASSYKFYLAFENSVCVDYVSEKFFEPLRHGIIPVVFGGADYSRFPKKSYIDVADFRSPKQLADYLRYLAHNETAYNEYFEWRLRYHVLCLNKEKLYCDLCSMMHKGFRNQHDDVGKWWSKDACQNDKINRIM